jgi:hypothetical protein
VESDSVDYSGWVYTYPMALGRGDESIKSSVDYVCTRDPQAIGTSKKANKQAALKKILTSIHQYHEFELDSGHSSRI